MANLTELSNEIKTTTEMQPLLDMVEQIMSIPEESLNEASIEVMSGMINGALTPRIKKEAIKNIIQGFEEEGYNRAKALHAVEEAKTVFQDAINELKPSPNKRALLNTAFNYIYESFDEAVAQYHTYDLELPIKMDKGAKMPTYAHETDACADIYALENTIIKANTFGNKIHTGLYLGTPENWQVGILPRSSIGANTPLRLSNSRAVIDEDYRGEIIILYDNISDSDYEIKVGDRIAQMFVQPVYRFKGIPVDILPATERGEGGLGSTGK